MGVNKLAVGCRMVVNKLAAVSKSDWRGMWDDSKQNSKQTGCSQVGLVLTYDWRFGASHIGAD